MANNGKYAKPSASLTPVLLRVAFVLLCLLMVSMYLMGGLLAKYTANGSGDDSARVAKFDVDVTFSDGNGTISDITADLKYGENGEYTITVVNKSEVAISYVIRIENIKLVTTDKNGAVVATAMTQGVSTKLETYGQEPKTYALKEGIASLNFGSFGILSPGSSKQTHTLSFLIDWETYTAKVAGSHLISVNITFNVVVDVTQVD